MNQVSNVDRDKIIEIIQRTGFFKSFSIQEQRRVVDMRTHLYTCEEGEFLIKDGSDDTSFYILLKGSVTVSKEDPKKPFATLKSGDSFGEIAFFTGENRTADVIAVEQCIVLKIDRASFDRFDIEIREKFKDNFIRKLVSRLDQMNNAYVNRWK